MVQIYQAWKLALSGVCDLFVQFSQCSVESAGGKNVLDRNWFCVKPLLLCNAETDQHCSTSLSLHWSVIVCAGK